MERGCGIECDLRLTRDRQVLVFHDRDAARLCANPLVIAASTAAELSGLRLGEEPIPSLAQLLDLVAGRAPLLLEVKAEKDHERWIPALEPLLARYAGPLGIMSFDPRIARLARIHLPRFRAGLVVADGLSPLRRRMAMALASPDFLAVEVAALGRPWVARARRRMPVYSWTVRSPADLAQARVHADAPIWEANGRP